MRRERDFLRGTQEMMARYERGDYAGALAVTGRMESQFPEQSVRTTFWRVCLLTRLQKIDEALQTLAKALEAGMWWSEPILRHDPDLEPLQGLPEYERMVATCRERHAAAQAGSRAAMVVREPADSSGSYPLLVALHGQGSTVEAELFRWEKACALGWLVAAIQSSQLAWPGGYAWNDREKAQEEVTGQFQELCAQQRVGPSRVIVAGFSQGGSLAIRLALNGGLPVMGFLAVVPGLIDQKLLEEWAGTPRMRSVRGYLVAGGRDPRYGFFKQVCETLPQYGIPCRMEDHPELGHEFPPGFKNTLKKAMDFLQS